MWHRESEDNSGASYGIVHVPVPPRRRPRVPATVQSLLDRFGVVTNDYETAVVTETFPYHDVTEVKIIESQDGESEPRYSMVYGEWAEKLEVHRRQAARPADFGRYVEEVIRHLQEVEVDEQGNLVDKTRARGGMSTRQRQYSKEREREGKLNVWREAARSEVDLNGFGEPRVTTNGTVRKNSQSTYTTNQGMIKPRGVEPTLPEKSQSSVSRSCRVYTPVEFYALRPQKTTGNTTRHARDPSPARSERIYTLAEINAIIGRSKNHPLPVTNSFTGKQHHYNGYTNSSSPPQRPNIKHLSSSPGRIQSCSTSSIAGVLASCQPSLAHITPILSNVGIRGKEHFRAFARLREETRDREMKEEILRQGVTLLEWAILVDKLQEFRCLSLV